MLPIVYQHIDIQLRLHQQIDTNSKAVHLSLASISPYLGALDMAFLTSRRFTSRTMEKSTEVALAVSLTLLHLCGSQGPLKYGPPLFSLFSAGSSCWCPYFVTPSLRFSALLRLLLLPQTAFNRTTHNVILCITQTLRLSSNSRCPIGPTKTLYNDQNHDDAGSAHR
jgi:hypothetical protein